MGFASVSFHICPGRQERYVSAPGFPAGPKPALEAAQIAKTVMQEMILAMPPFLKEALLLRSTAAGPRSRANRRSDRGRRRATAPEERRRRRRPGTATGA